MASTPAEDASRLHRQHDEPEPASTDDPARSATADRAGATDRVDATDRAGAADTTGAAGAAGAVDAASDGETRSGTASAPRTEPDRAPSTAEPRHRLEPAPVPAAPVIRPTRISGTWVAVIVAAVVLIFLLIFILQNLTTVTVNFLGFSGSLPLGVAMLFAAIGGAILVALVGTARILQLRRFARRVGMTTRSPRQRS